ncbi:alanyl-tRNA editing protein [Candidatus Woesearchaeota archaeon]|nr:alanyl-tRNA editing protein [Candidatus Woesearchaeota archaeon]
MSKALYMDDSYLKEFESVVEKVVGDSVVLKETAFYPSSGGQPHDTGFIVRGVDEFKVVDVRKESGEIIHVLEANGLVAGDVVKGFIDWNRRYNLMKAHTATHVLCSILHNETGALITGNQLYEDKLRIDFNLDNYDKELLKELVNKANGVLVQDHSISSYYLSREKAFKLPGALKLANILPPNIKTLRIVEIEGVDVQVDGGTHVKSTSEVKNLKLLKTENKGKNNRRLVVGFE